LFRFFISCLLFGCFGFIYSIIYCSFGIRYSLASLLGGFNRSLVHGSVKLFQQPHGMLGLVSDAGHRVKTGEKQHETALIEVTRINHCNMAPGTYTRPHKTLCFFTVTRLSSVNIGYPCRVDTETTAAIYCIKCIRWFVANWDLMSNRSELWRR